MKPKHLVILDLDGTALYDWKTLHEETINTIKSIKQQGHIVVIATGRPYRSSKPFYDLLELDTPIINYNGALIHHPGNEEFEGSMNYIPVESIYKTFEEIPHLINNAFCEHYDDIFLYKEDKEIEPLLHLDGGNLKVGDFKDILTINPNGFIIIAKPNQGTAIEEYISKNFAEVLNHRNWGGEYGDIIEIYTPQTCKGIALKKITDYFKIDIKNVIAFGDGDNDYEMIKIAGWGVAMGNALDHVKEVAKDIAPSNREHGVAQYLKKYFEID